MPLHHYLPAAYLGEFSKETSLPRRNRRLVVGDKKNNAIFRARAKNIAAINNLYTLVSVKNEPELVDEIWSDYERNLNNAIDSLVNRTLNGSTWGRVLVPFVAAMLVRTPDFDERFSRRLAYLGVSTDILPEDNTNFARVMDLQRLLGPIAVAKWTVFQISGSGSLLSNDIGYAPFADEPTKEIGIGIPLNKTHLLGLIPKDERVVCTVLDDEWIPNIRYITLYEDNHLQFNQAIAANADRFIFGPDESTIADCLDPSIFNMDRPSPMALGFLSGKMALAHEFTWHRLVPALERNPKDSDPWDFKFDFEQLKKGWNPPTIFPENLIGFPSALRRESDSIIAEFFDPEVYFIISGINFFEQIGEIELIQVEAKKGLQIAEKPEHIAIFLIALGNYYGNIEDSETALDYYTQAIQHYPESMIALNNRAAIYIEFNDLHKALDDLLDAITYAPDFGIAHLNCGNIYYFQGNIPKAIDSLDEAVMHLPPGPMLGNTLLTQGRIFREIGEVRKALEVLVAANNEFYASSDKAKCHYEQAICLHLLEMQDEAITTVKQSIKLFPDQPEYYDFLTSMLFETDDEENALSILNELIEYELPIDMSGKVYDYISRLNIIKQDIDSALDASKKAVDIDPTNKKYITNYGIAQMYSGKFSCALRSFNLAIKLDPMDYVAYNNRGVIYKALGKIRLALKDHIKASDLDSSNADGSPRRHLGLCHLFLNNISDAEDCLDNSKQIEEDKFYNSLLEGLIHTYKGNYRNAYEILSAMDVNDMPDLYIYQAIPLLLIGEKSKAYKIAKSGIDRIHFKINLYDFLNHLFAIAIYNNKRNEITKLLRDLDLGIHLYSIRRFRVQLTCKWGGNNPRDALK